MHFKETQKKFLVNNFCVPELYTLKFVTPKETMVMQISAISLSPNVYSEKSYNSSLNENLEIVMQQIFAAADVEKISVYFLAICANFPCKFEKFELEVVGVGILGTGFCFQGSHEHIL